MVCLKDMTFYIIRGSWVAKLPASELVNLDFHGQGCGQDYEETKNIFTTQKRSR